MVDSTSPVSGTVYDGIGSYINLFIMYNYCLLIRSMHVFIYRMKIYQQSMAQKQRYRCIWIVSKKTSNSLMAQ
jgi:hypothetical protein